MAILTGRVRGREIKKNRDGTTDKILLQVELTSPDDIQTVEWINHDGEDSSPPDNSLVIVVAISNSYKIAIACDDGVLAESEPGEKILYSQLNGKKRTSIVLKTDGSILIDTKDVSGSQESKIEMNSDGEINVNSFKGMTLNSSEEISLSGTSINLNGSGDFAVRFLALQVAIETLITSLTSHTHLGVEPGGGISGIPSSPFLIDLTPAKVESVKLP